MQKTKISAYVSTFLISYLFWILLTWSFDTQELIAGAIVSAAASLFSARFFIHSSAFHLIKPGRLAAFIAYIFVFMAELWKANVDVAKRCFAGCKNVNPGVIRVPVELEGDYAQAMLANSITLTPGTMTLDIAKDENSGKVFYYIHWIDITDNDAAAAGEAIKGRMEKWIRRI